MQRTLPVYTKIAITISILCILIAGGFFSLSIWSAERYHQEVTQKLHAGLATYVLEHLSEPLFLESSDSSIYANKDLLKSIAMNTMMINPSVEVYLLDPLGEIKGHALPEATIEEGRVDIEIVKNWINEQKGGYVLGDNPRNPGVRSIFSAAPIIYRGEISGYLYIILASHEAKSLADELSSNHILRTTLSAIGALALLFSLSAMFTFKRITQPLQELTNEIRKYRKKELRNLSISPLNSINSNTHGFKGDEVAELSDSFDLMQIRIQQQFEQLNETDRLRRELVSNVSHDLRTPLSSIQGYLETLLIKHDQLSDEKKHDYIEIAHRSSQHLRDLIAQLFELSKLEAGGISPNYEVFSLTELVYDVKQEYELQAQTANISLNIQTPPENIMVTADISLLQRVMHNLLDNALSHTPESGDILLRLEVAKGKVEISVLDSGSGISKNDLPFVFERYYQSSEQSEKSLKVGSGLGLSIVKKILELHNTAVKVSSELHQGTKFSFSLESI